MVFRNLTKMGKKAKKKHSIKVNKSNIQSIGHNHFQRDLWNRGNYQGDSLCEKKGSLKQHCRSSFPKEMRGGFQALKG